MTGGNFKHYNTRPPTSKRVLPLFSLRGRTAIISGAGAGIGLAAARAFAEAGANVAIWYNSNKDALKRAAEIEDEFGVKCRAYSVNVTVNEEVVRAIESQTAEFGGRLDVFVANAGVAWTQGSMIDGSVSTYHKLMEVNVDGTFYCARACGRIWRRQAEEGKIAGFRTGSFIATSSMSGHIANIPNFQSPYNASKAAIRHLVKSLSVECVRFARFNSISPGYIKTELSNFIPPETKDVWRDKIPMGREGETRELVGAYLYLASDASSYATGMDMCIDGGYTAP